MLQCLIILLCHTVARRHAKLLRPLKIISYQNGADIQTPTAAFTTNNNLITRNSSRNFIFRFIARMCEKNSYRNSVQPNSNGSRGRTPQAYCTQLAHNRNEFKFLVQKSIISAISKWTFVIKTNYSVNLRQRGRGHTWPGGLERSCRLIKVNICSIVTPNRHGRTVVVILT